MKKGALAIISIIIISCISFSCKQSKSLQELLQEEKKAIDKFVTMNDLVILKTYPSDGVFKENEYYQTSDGLFFHVVDSGNGKKVKPADDVSVRYAYSQYIKNVVSGDTTQNTFFSYRPFSFVYGLSATYQSPNSPICQGWVIPLSYVGENAVVDMIVPSSLGSYSDYSVPNIAPVFYKNLRYTRFN